ncbi:hypothetical protein GGTG_11799 [Gaeumannomyces tritici R3-111a-1]|uniref:Uncharacterized protein n=1 Tax=Gaeumannomyces tritici (strain R3-111a-1) TaxID=644352 RepID=J3PE76_GAET3|nr:hypothetical protein GGTG_11799 [Gaeumannomyces tritici R3-111a-1]EJT70776.1 hypothetical protein GGTG_11799 [Gaeumannomyces tritici R3-111a-1]
MRHVMPVNPFGGSGWTPCMRHEIYGSSTVRYPASRVSSPPTYPASIREMPPPVTSRRPAQSRPPRQAGHTALFLRLWYDDPAFSSGDTASASLPMANGQWRIDWDQAADVVAVSAIGTMPSTLGYLKSRRRRRPKY